MRHEYLSVYNLKNHTLVSEQATVEALSVGSISVGGGGALSTDIDLKAKQVNSVFTISGAVRIKLAMLCKTNYSATGAPTLWLGVSNDPNFFITGTVVADLAAGEWWTSSTGANNNKNLAKTAGVFDYLMNDDKVKITVSAATAEQGVITAYAWWEPIETGATVVVSS